MSKNLLKLNIKQELFCNFYVLDQDCFGNGTKSYSFAYTVAPDGVCAANASRLLRNDNIIRRINTLLEENFKPEIVDREHMRLILQNKDLGAKMAAIREYNKVKGRVAEKVDTEIVVRWENNDDFKK